MVEAGQHPMKATDMSKIKRIIVMPSTVPDPPEVGGVKVEPKPCKGNQPRNVGIVATKATEKASGGKSGPIHREPGPETVPDMPTRETDSVRTTPKYPEESEKGLSS